MLDIRNVLLATDFQQGSEAAENAAIQLAWVAESKVAICHVHEFQFVQPDLQKRMEKRISLLLEQIKLKFEKERVEVPRTSSPVGHPVLELLREAQEVKAGLILVGAGPKEDAHFRIGPIAEALMVQSPTSVLAVRPGVPPPSFRKILCAVDLSSASLEALKSAVLLANKFAAELRVVMVMSPTPWSSTLYEASVPMDLTTEYRDGLVKGFDDFLKEVDFSGLRWTKELLDGLPAPEIIEACRRQGADLLVMGAIGGTGLSRLLLGSVSRRILRDLPCSILIAR